MLSVQVHPDDVYAARMNSAAARASAGIFLRRQNTAEKRSCAPRLPPEWWNHALFANRYKKATLSIFRQGAFMRLAKVSAHLKYSSQAILHTVYTDWGRKRGETHIAQGLRAVSYDVPALCVSQFLDFFSCPYFSLRTVCSCTITDTDDFALFMLTGGMLYGGTESFAVSVEDAVFCRGGETAALETGMRAVCHAVLSNSLLCSFTSFRRP